MECGGQLTAVLVLACVVAADAAVFGLPAARPREPAVGTAGAPSWWLPLAAAALHAVLDSMVTRSFTGVLGHPLSRLLPCRGGPVGLRRAIA
jgi:hypothetical protein